MVKRVPVLVLAGSRLGEDDELAKAGGVSHKALLPVAKVPMIERVLEAITLSDIASEIYIASETDSWIKESALAHVKYLKSSPTLPETIHCALQKIGYPCLITTADHALLRPEWLIEFLSKSLKNSSDATVGIAERKKVEALSLKMFRTYIHLKDLEFSGCNLFLMKTPSSKNLIHLWAQVHKFRKSPLRMAKILGIRFLFKALFRQIDLKTFLEKIYKMSGTSLKLICLEDGKAAIDVDSLKDWRVAEKLLSDEKT